MTDHDSTDPAQLPAVDPPAAPASSVQGLAVDVESSRTPQRITLRNDGPSTLVGQATFHLVWVGSPGQPDARPWRSVGTLQRGCEAPQLVDPVHTHRGALAAGASISWEPPGIQAAFCVGNELRSMAAPAGRYRIAVRFRSEDRTVDLQLWSMAFVRLP